MPATPAVLFAVPDPEAFRGVVALAAGGAALGGMMATGEAVDRLITLPSSGPSRPGGMPSHVLVVATAQGAMLFAHSRHAIPGTQAASFGAGQFKAHASRHPFTIDLSITPGNGEPLVLSGKRGPHGVAQTVKVALALAGEFGYRAHIMWFADHPTTERQRPSQQVELTRLPKQTVGVRPRLLGWLRSSA